MKLKNICIIVLIAIISCISTNVLAESEYEMNLTGNNEIAQGKIIDLTLSIKNMKFSSDDEIEITGFIDYDRQIFEKLIESNIISQNNWQVSYDEETSEITANISQGALKDGTICKLNFKVRENAEIQNTTNILVKDCIARISDSEQGIQAQNAEIQLNYKENTSIVNIPKTEKVNNTSENKPESNKTNNSVINKNNTNKSQQESSSNKGTVELYVALALLMVVIIAIGIVVFLRYRK